MHWIRHHLPVHNDRSQRGAVAAEFALIMPVLLILLFGIIQFSIAFNRHQAVHAAAREGARVASLPYTTNQEVCDRVNDALNGVNFQSPAQCFVDQACGGASTKAVVRVQAEHTIDLAIAGTTNLTIRGQGEFRCE